MQMRIMVFLTLVSLTPALAIADAITIKADAVATMYSGSSAAATTLLSSVMDTVKAQSEREMELNLASVGEVLDFLKLPPLKIENPQYVGTYRGLFIPFPSLHGMADDTIVVTTAGKSIGNTPAIVVAKAGGALWFSSANMAKEEVTIGGVRYWKITAAFRKPGQKVPTLPASLRQQPGASWDRFGWFLEFMVICPNQADTSSSATPTAPAGTTTVTTTTTPATVTAPAPATSRVRRRVSATPATATPATATGTDPCRI